MFVISGIIWAGKAQCNGQHNLGIFMFLRKHCFSFPNSCARTNQGCSEAYRLPRKKYGYIHKIIQVIREISRITKWVIATAHNRFLLDTQIMFKHIQEQLGIQSSSSGTQAIAVRLQCHLCPNTAGSEEVALLHFRGIYRSVLVNCPDHTAVFSLTVPYLTCFQPVLLLFSFQLAWLFLPLLPSKFTRR